MLLKNFYSVVSTIQNESGYCTELKINKNHQLYKGHFPNRPVTPGVILMQLFKEEAERLTKQKLQLQKASNVKFTAVVDPNEEENLKLHSSLDVSGGVVTLKGTAEHKDCIALKINSVFIVQP